MDESDTSTDDDFSIDSFHDFLQHVSVENYDFDDIMLHEGSSDIDSMLEYSFPSNSSASGSYISSASTSDANDNSDVFLVDMAESNSPTILSPALGDLAEEHQNSLTPSSSYVEVENNLSNTIFGQTSSPVVAADNVVAENNLGNITVNQNTSNEKPQVGNTSLLSQSSEDEGQICSICFERWTNSDNHRLASLKCGHLFGHSCIYKWLSGNGKKCPQCNVNAKRSDIRVLFAKSLKALDTSERDRALLELEKEKEIRRKVEIERYQLKLQCDQMREECTKLQNQITFYKKHGNVEVTDGMLMAAGASSASQVTSDIKFLFHKEILVSKNNSCRVLSCCDSLSMICVSQPSTNNLFQGYGVKKINSLDLRTAEFVYLHSGAIRDISFQPDTMSGQLLSVSVDKSVKLSNMSNNSVIHEYKCDTPVWSCAWNLDNLDQFFAGTINGTILLHDIRNTSKCLEVISSGASSPVVSMKYVKEKSSAEFKYGGLLVSQLDRFTFHQTPFDDPFKQFILPIRGNFTSVDFNDSTRQFLLSSRPFTDFSRCRHLLGELYCSTAYCHPNSPSISSNIVLQMNGGRSHKMLSRSKFVTCNERMFVCSGDESSSSIMIWDANTGMCFEKLPTTSPVLDIGTATVAKNQLLLTLTESTLSAYKIQ